MHICTNVHLRGIHALGSFFKHSSLVDISQKIFQHNRTNFENLSTIEPFLMIEPCKGIYTAPLVARALAYGVEKHLVVNMECAFRLLFW